jgi:hypothetical protein
MPPALEDEAADAGGGPKRRKSYYSRAGCLEKSALEMLAVLVSMGMPARSAGTAAAAESRGPEIYFVNTIYQPYAKLYIV